MASALNAALPTADSIWKSATPVGPSLLNKTQAAPLATDGTMIFGYCQNFYTGLGTGSSGVTLKAAIGISADQAAEWKGNKVSKILIGYGQSMNRNVTIFISNTLTGTPVYTQTATMLTLNGWNEVLLSQPFEIDGSAFYIGYQTTTRSTGDYPIGIDGIGTNEKLADNIAVGNSWDHIGTSYGAVCIRIGVSGDDLPEFDVAVRDCDIPEVVKANTPFDATVLFTNKGTATVTDVTAVCSIEGKTVSPSSVEFTTGSVAPGGMGQIVLHDVVCTTEGIGLPFEVTLTTVNGEADVKPEDNSGSATFACAQTVYPRNVVVEEWTGSWCGYCPRGIVGMEYMEANYADKGFIGIAIHSSSSPGAGTEPMECSTYLPFLSMYCDGFPGSIINRTYASDPNKSDLESYFLYMSQSPSLASVEVTGTYFDDDPFNLHAEANVKFALSSDNASYRVAFVLLEDGVGPYPQTNYFSGGASGPLEGWDNQGSRVNTVYNHVARDIFDAFGINGSVPTKVEKGTDNRYAATLSRAHVGNIDNCHIVALLINSNTRAIENAAKAVVAHKAGVDGVENDIANDEPVEFFNLQGIRVENPSNGVFIRKQGATTTKVLIR